MEAMLLALIDTGAPFDPAAVFIGVGIALDNQGSETVRADITPALGTAGTATAATTWSAPYKMNDGRWAVQAPVKTFKIASSSDACNLVVWYLASLATLGVLLGFGPVFPNVGLSDEFSLYSLVVRLVIDPAGRWDAIVSWNG